MKDLIRFLGSPVTRNFILTLSIGVTFGFTFAFMFLNSGRYSNFEFGIKGPPPYPESYRQPMSHAELEQAEGPVQNVQFHSPDEWTHKGG